MRKQRYFYPTKKTTLASRIFRIVTMILVTGGTGLVGSHLLYQLTSQNKQVRAIYRASKSLEAVKKVFSYFTDNSDALFSKIDWIKADITDVPSLEKVFVNVDIVYHVAALVSFNPKEYRKMRQVNIDGTANIVNYSIAYNVQKLCFVSSISAIGDSINNEVVTEENDWSIESGNNGYSITKHGAEMEVWRASQEGIDVIVVNPGVILGAGFWNLNTGQLFSKVAKGFPYFTEGVTGFVGVVDVAKAMINLTESAIKNEGFILVSENRSFKDIFSEIAKNLDKKPPTIKISKAVTFFLSSADAIISFITGKKRAITKYTAKSLHSKTYYSSEKIKNSLGFEFTPVKSVIKEVCVRYKKDY
jgi:dihydroflavonol-4-reductase